MCPFVKNGECEIPPCKDCYLPCSEKEKAVGNPDKLKGGAE
jgi:hypothetical protein